MSKVAIEGNASGTGTLTIAAPNTNTNRTITLPDATGTLALTGTGLTGATDSGTPFETSLGTGAGAVTTGVNNTFIGFEAGNDNSTGTDNTAVGFKALDVNTTGGSNTAVGSGALGLNTVGINNTVVGHAAFANSTASSNTGLGYGAGNSTTTGACNIAVGGLGSGYAVFETNTTGSNNIVMGCGALSRNTTAENNVAIGHLALHLNTTGEKNTAVGSLALDACTTGFLNTALGSNALGSVTTGLGNIAIGDEAGQGGVNLTTGNDNTLIGRAARTNTQTSSNQIVIGTNLTGTGNNEVAIGSNAGKIHNAYTVNATWTQTSDERLKKNIQEDTLGLSFINRLRPVKYQWKPSNEIDPSLPYYDEVNRRNTQAVMHGLVAQEVKSALDAEGVTTFAGWSVTPDMIQGISREMFVSPLIKAIQELSAQVTALQAEVNSLKGQP